MCSSFLSKAGTPTPILAMGMDGVQVLLHSHAGTLGRTVRRGQSVTGWGLQFLLRPAPLCVVFQDRSFIYLRSASNCKDQDGLDLLILMIASPKCWDYRYVPPPLALQTQFLNTVSVTDTESKPLSS